jgi:hypothetical protein
MTNKKLRMTNQKTRLRFRRPSFKKCFEKYPEKTPQFAVLDDGCYQLPAGATARSRYRRPANAASGSL